MFTQLLGLAIAATALLFCPKAEGMPSPKGTTRALLINDDISTELALVVDKMREDAIANPTAKVVPVFILSDGGRTSAMAHIINNMRLLKAAGFQLNCLAVVAQSAAYMIWLECDKRSVLPNSKLMFHYPYIVYPYAIGADDAKSMANSLEASRDAFRHMLMAAMENFMSPMDIEHAALTSRTWSGEELCSPRPQFCQITNVVRSYK